MNEVKRYDIEADTPYACVHHYDRADGDWVKFEDYAVLEADRHALAAENLALKSAIECHMAGFSVCDACGEDNTCGNDDVGIVLKEIPATDAYANQLRAEGVAMVRDEFKKHDEQFKVRCDWFISKLLKENGNG